MGGPSVTTGPRSKQDYGTPWDFISGAVAKRFGVVGFDLAAHADNAKSGNYFAPEWFIDKGTMGELTESLAALPSTADLDSQRIASTEGYNKKKEEIFVRHIRNVDPKAYAYNALNRDWVSITKQFGFGFLNCEFSDIAPWAVKCFEEGKKGADVGLLVPAAVSNWWRDYVAGRADTYLMNGRLSFDGKNPYPKDLMFCHFGPRASGRILLWKHSTDEIFDEWRSVKSLT
jgi:hypothetical protein